MGLQYMCMHQVYVSMLLCLLLITADKLNTNPFSFSKRLRGDSTLNFECFLHLYLYTLYMYLKSRLTWKGPGHDAVLCTLERLECESIQQTDNCGKGLVDPASLESTLPVMPFMCSHNIHPCVMTVPGLPVKTDQSQADRGEIGRNQYLI